jgi:hypothetical protein
MDRTQIMLTDREALAARQNGPTVDATTILTAARAALDEQAHRTADLVRSLPDTATAIPRSEWTIREAAVHLATGAALYAEIATGTPSPIDSLEKEAVGAFAAGLIADIPETDPGKLAHIMTSAAGRLLDATANRPGDQSTVWHAGFPLDLAGLVCIILGEHLIHGYDMAVAASRPWPIDPGHAGLVLFGYGPIYSLILNPATTAHLTASYQIELSGGDAFIVRFTDGAYSLEPAGSGPIDCTISADPVAFLLVGSGRLPQHAAIALGLLTTAGNRPDLALGFKDLFIYP